MMKKLFIGILILTVAILVVIKIINVEILDIKPYKFNKIPYILFFSSLIALIIPLIFEKKLIFLSIFNFIGIFIVSAVALSFFYQTEDFEKIDYFLSQKVNKYEYKKYKDKFNWTNERFKIADDTIFYVYTTEIKEKKNQKYTLSKSLFQKYYYLVKAN